MKDRLFEIHEAQFKDYYQKKLKGQTIVEYWGCETFSDGSIYVNLKLSDKKFSLAEYCSDRVDRNLNNVCCDAIEQYFEQNFVGKKIVDADFRIKDLREWYIYAFVNSELWLEMPFGLDAYDFEAIDQIIGFK